MQRQVQHLHHCQWATHSLLLLLLLLPHDVLQHLLPQLPLLLALHMLSEQQHASRCRPPATL
jgi:hypothetical protein